MKVDPLPKRVTLPRLATGFNQLHACLEDLSEKTATDLGQIKETMGDVADFIKPFRAFARFVDKYGRWMIGIVVTAFISAWASVLVTTVILHQQSDQKAAVAAQNAKAATQQSQAIAATVGAPITPTPKAAP